MWSKKAFDGRASLLVLTLRLRSRIFYKLPRLWNAATGCPNSGISYELPRLWTQPEGDGSVAVPRFDVFLCFRPAGFATPGLTSRVASADGDVRVHRSAHNSPRFPMRVASRRFASRRLMRAQDRPEMGSGGIFLRRTSPQVFLQ
jgi:hypothetical protein